MALSSSSHLSRSINKHSTYLRDILYVSIIFSAAAIVTRPRPPPWISQFDYREGIFGGGLERVGDNKPGTWLCLLERSSRNWLQIRDINCHQPFKCIRYPHITHAIPTMGRSKLGGLLCMFFGSMWYTWGTVRNFIAIYVGRTKEDENVSQSDLKSCPSYNVSLEAFHPQKRLSIFVYAK